MKTPHLAFLHRITHITSVWRTLRASASFFVTRNRTPPPPGAARSIVRLRQESCHGFDGSSKTFTLCRRSGSLSTLLVVVNADSDTKSYCDVFCLPVYSVTIAELSIPASDVVRHITTASTETPSRPI
ncbi:hypothetical protein EDD15DRAFT_933396 [Pisolithus albus]|nr:hypothetical protein EDD15DRAFT_933396 [Pisolithus albus]